MPWKVPKLWEGERCFILGGGTSIPGQFNTPPEIIKNVANGAMPPSALSEYMSSIHNEHVIGVNNAYKIGDWIDILFFGDCTWHHIHRFNLANHPSLKVTCCKRFASKEDNPERIKYIAKDRPDVGISKHCDRVGWNKNSGAATISLAVHLGVTQIVLLGFDMKLGNNNISHFFGSHNKRPKEPPPFKRHLQGFPQIQKDAKTMGVEILNANPDSEISVFRKINLNDIL